MNTEHLQDYLDRSGDDKVYTTNLTENEHGFATWSIDGDTLIAVNVYGDGLYWNNFMDAKAKENGCNKVRFSTRRNAEAMKRKFKFNIVGYVLEREVL